MAGVGELGVAEARAASKRARAELLVGVGGKVAVAASATADPSGGPAASAAASDAMGVGVEYGPGRWPELAEGSAGADGISVGRCCRGSKASKHE